MIDDVLEPIAPTPVPRRRRARLTVAAVAVLAVLAGGLAVATSGEGEPEPLALVAGDASGGARSEGTAAPAPAPMAAADARMAIDPAYWGGIEYEVDGDLGDLPGRAATWRVVTPDLDREGVSRWADALGLSGTPQMRDGAWVVESPEATFSAYPGDGWSISFNRSPGERTGGDVTAAGAEAQARALLDRLGVLEGEWRVQTYESEIGFGYACAEDLKLREEEIARLDPDAPAASEPALMPVPDCPPPAPPVKAHNVSFFPVVDGMRTEWGVWSLTVGPEGIENLYGSLVSFEQGDEYRLRSVDDAVEELRRGGRVLPLPAPMPMPADDMPMPADDVAVPAVGPATDPAVDVAASSGSAGGGTSGSAASPVGVEPAPAIAPGPCPPEADCQAPEPRTVTITGVELTLIPNAVYSGEPGGYRMYLVPAYRFTGTFEGGEAWETTTIALHDDAIAPPPPADAPPAVDGGAVETLPAPAPAGMGETSPPPAPDPERSPAG